MTPGQKAFEAYYANSEGVWEHVNAEEQQVWENVARDAAQASGKS